jgi:hypothetical protein
VAPVISIFLKLLIACCDIRTGELHSGHPRHGRQGEGDDRDEFLEARVPEMRRQAR